MQSTNLALKRNHTATSRTLSGACRLLTCAALSIAITAMIAATIANSATTRLFTMQPAFTGQAGSGQVVRPTLAVLLVAR